MATTKIPILTLGSLADCQVVDINGTPYELLTHTRLPVLDGYRLGRYGARLTELSEQGARAPLTEAEEGELGTLPDLICRLILLAPDDVQAALTKHDRAAIMDAFFSGPRTPSTDPERPTPSPSPSSIGANGSHGSVASTQGVPH